MWHLRLFSTNDLVPEGLIVILELLELFQTLIEVHAKVGDDVADVVRVPGVVLHHDAHDATDKLYIWSGSPEGRKIAATLSFG